MNTIEKYGQNPAAAAAIARRWEAARSIRDKVEQVAGVAVGAMVNDAFAGGLSNEQRTATLCKGVVTPR
ncbi:MAG: hypothetical protein PVI60_05945 [Desulfobacteraceae bacterium]|jgi:hypothetical protein